MRAAAAAVSPALLSDFLPLFCFLSLCGRVHRQPPAPHRPAPLRPAGPRPAPTQPAGREEAVRAAKQDRWAPHELHKPLYIQERCAGFKMRQTLHK